MSDDEIKNNIKKCSRCALCVQNCPIYDIKKDENNTSRGLICKLSGYFENKLSKKEISHDLKICLNCSKCKSNCPSKVDTSYIFAYKNAQLSPSKISQRILLLLKLLPIKILYIFNFFKKRPSKISSNIVYFKGCIARAQHKTTFLDKIAYLPNFLCCGLPYLTSGDLKNYNKAKKRNIEIVKSTSCVVFDCASCKSAVEEYNELSEEDKNKLIFFVELLDKKFKLKPNSKYKSVTFHKPCHMAKTDFLKIEKFLGNIEGLNYIPLEDSDKCCGFGGSYFMFHPVISAKIALKKAFDIKKTNTDLILTACPSCTMGLRFGQLISGSFKKTLEFRDFVDNELTICQSNS